MFHLNMIAPQSIVIVIGQKYPRTKPAPMAWAYICEANYTARNIEHIFEYVWNVCISMNKLSQCDV